MSYNCPYCNRTVQGNEVNCPGCGYPLTSMQQPLQQQNYEPYPPLGAPMYYPKNKIAAGLLAILLGFLGIHKFYLGYTGTGLIFLLCAFFSCGTLSTIFYIIAVIEGIIYLTKTDEEFHQIYVVNRQEWF